MKIDASVIRFYSNLENITDFQRREIVTYLANEMKKKPHGGKRKGAGRPVTKEPTVVMRIPKSKVEAVKKLISPKGKRQQPPQQ